MRAWRDRPAPGARPRVSALCFLALCISFTALRAEVSLPSIFGDHMVLQQGTTIPVWGFAEPGERISVEFEGRRAETVTAPSGRWRVTLRPLPYSSSSGSMVINGANRIEFRDVIVGDVWICAGGENMVMPLSEATGGREAAAASDPGLRCFVPASRDAEHPVKPGSGSWVVCTPETAISFPAIPFFFARDLRASRQVPVGIIDCAVATPGPIASWISPKGIRSHGGVAGREGIPKERPSATFNAMIAPLLPYAITGAVWYQEEADGVGAAFRQRILLPRLIRDWRAQWKQGPFPFLIVSPAGFGGMDDSAVEPLLSQDGKPRRALPWLREALLASQTLPATGIAVTTDLGEPDDRHPPDKLPVGRRLARLARHRVYGEDIADTGPALRRISIEGNKVRLAFDTGGGGLTVGISPAALPESHETPARLASSLKGFALAGANRRWFPATARIEGDEVVLSSDAVPLPEAVRYNWKGYPVGNLYNTEGLPAPPFRSDTDQPR